MTLVTFARSLLETYEDDAKKIADAPENAAARLKLAMDDLRKALGPILTGIGNMFINLATTIVEQITRMFNAINNARAAQALGGQRQAQTRFDEAAENLRQQQQAFEQADDKSTGGAAYQRLRNATEGYEMATRSLRQANQNVAATKLPFSASGKPLEEKLTPTPDGGGSGSGSKSGPKDRTAELRAQLALEQSLLEIEQKRFGLRGVSGQMEEFRLQKLEREKALTEELKQIQLENITAESKVLASEVARVQAARDLQSIQNAQKQFEQEQLEAFKEQLQDLETEIAIEEAITEEQRAQLRLAQEIKKVRGDDNLTDDQKDQLEDRLKQLEKARQSNQGLSGYMKQLQAELMDTEAMIVSLAQTVESELSSAMSTAITGLLDGTKTAEEAFADMFANIGKAFIDMATQIIAKQLVLIALQSTLKALGLSFGGGGASAVPGSAYGDTSIAGPGFFEGGFIDGFTPSAPGLPDYGVMPMASGGYVTRPTNALVGEGAEPEYVIPESRMSGAMERYSGGARGESVINGAGFDQEEGGSLAFGDAPISISTGPVMQFNSTNYVTQEEFAAGVKSAAKQGEERALRKLQSSPAQRRRIGLR